MEPVSRRRFVAALALGGSVVGAGCTASEDPDAALEYSISVGSGSDAIPEDVRDHYGQDGHEWVVVEISVVGGELDMEDVWFNSRVEAGDRYYELDHASGELSQGVQSRGAVQDGGEATALYQVPDGSDGVSWDLSQMDQDIDAQAQ